jgi:hypothetical protein
MLLHLQLLAFRRLKAIDKFSKTGGDVHNANANVFSEQRHKATRY